MTDILTDADNPIIWCTEKELGWSVWQISRGQIDWKLDPRGLTAILDAEPAAKFLYEEAWELICVEWVGRPKPAQSLRELMSMIWDKAREGRSFENYWTDAVVKFQPTIGTAQFKIPTRG